MTFHANTAVSDLVTRLNVLTYAHLNPTTPSGLDESPGSNGYSVLCAELPQDEDENDSQKHVRRVIDPNQFPALENFPVVQMDPRNILPVLDYYGKPQIPPPYPQPVRWMQWSRKAVGDAAKTKLIADSDESFGEPELTTVPGIQATALRSKEMLQAKHKLLFEELSRDSEKEQIERKLNETLLKALDHAKNQSMAAIGDTLRENEQLELRLKDLALRLKETETETVTKLHKLDSRGEKAARAIEKVIKEKDQVIVKLASEVKFLRTFAEEKDQVQASIDSLRSAARDRYQQQEMELQQIHDMQMAEQSKLQGLAADRLLALTEQSYDRVLENLDDETMGVFYKNCQVQDAVAIWLQRNKDLKKDKRLLRAKIQHVLERRKTAVNYLRRYGTRQGKIDRQIRHYRTRCEAAKTAYKNGTDAYENDCLKIVPAVQKQLTRKTTLLRSLERTKALRRAELMRTKQLLAIVDEERSSMEKGLIWAVRSVMRRTDTLNVDDLSWDIREMILRRVFVYMNLARCQSKDSDMNQLERDAEAYSSHVEKNIPGVRLLPRYEPDKFQPSSTWANSTAVRRPAAVEDASTTIPASTQRFPSIPEQSAQEAFPQFGFNRDLMRSYRLLPANYNT